VGNAVGKKRYCGKRNTFKGTLSERVLGGGRYEKNRWREKRRIGVGERLGISGSITPCGLGVLLGRACTVRGWQGVARRTIGDQRSCKALIRGEDWTPKHVVGRGREEKDDEAVLQL